jgi:hypothetical protein
MIDNTDITKADVQNQMWLAHQEVVTAIRAINAANEAINRINVLESYRVGGGLAPDPKMAIKVSAEATATQRMGDKLVMTAHRIEQMRLLYNEGYKHSYDIETVIDSQIAYVSIEANNRTQAAGFAEKQGYVVRSVNMTG